MWHYGEEFKNKNKFKEMKKDNPENVQPKDWITIGVRKAVVCKKYENEPNRIEIVYLDRNRAINEYARFIDGNWTFENEDSCGGYADNSTRLGEFVRILRAGRWWE